MDINSYLADIDPQRADRIRTIIDHIHILYPEADASMQYKMPTFRTESGWVAVANQKNYLSFYTCSAEHLVPFKQQYPDIKTGKGCINFRDKDELNLDALTPVIHSAMNAKSGR